MENDAQDSDCERENQCVPDQCRGTDAARDVGIPVILTTKVRNGPSEDRDGGERKGERIRELLGREPLTWSFWCRWSLFEFCSDVLLKANDRLRKLLFGGRWRNDGIADGRADED